ncbi:uncharacterized protein PAC_00378 [Phialocephala subalpina]|uniref:Metallo-beta-lactamase domain-containing protein n=1 Tax=Phialocephala subalpina TaxID=576137 RepID=A0A1L7WCI5_9HELO|nr:uncharacterized protein PAC_00378 [Phialocephala subalpina]
MSLTVKHLNTDASFLLTFQPLLPFPPTPGQSTTFTIVVDPWLSGPSNIFHPFFSSSKIKDAACISSLTELPEPNLIIVSQSKSDHCHKGTLTKLPKTGGKFIILAEPSAAKLIRSWKHFDESQVVTLKEWSKPSKHTSSPNIHRIQLAALTPRGEAGEVTVSLIKEGDTAGVKNAVAITYKAPTTGINQYPDLELPFTPPASPRSYLSHSTTRTSPSSLSILHAPHGISYTHLKPFIATHLIQSASLPLTALLHCFDRVQNPWLLGGNICTGAPSGMKIAEELMARCWISAHDGDKVTKGVANRRIKITKWGRQEIEDVVSPRTPGFPEREGGCEVVMLGAGEERTIGGGMNWPSTRRDIGIPKSKSCWDMRGGEDDETDVEVESVRAESLNKFHAI